MIIINVKSAVLLSFLMVLWNLKSNFINIINMSLLINWMHPCWINVGLFFFFFYNLNLSIVYISTFVWSDVTGKLNQEYLSWVWREKSLLCWARAVILGLGTARSAERDRGRIDSWFPHVSVLNTSTTDTASH